VSGILQVRVGSHTVSSATVVDFAASSSSLVQSTVNVEAGQTTADVDIYVPPPADATPLNAIALGVAELNLPVTFAQAGVEVSRGGSTIVKQLLVAGRGITAANGSTISVSGAGVSVVNPGQFQVLGDGTTIVFLTMSIAPNAPPGPRNIIVTNSNLDTAVLTGALLIK
jgi:hypothetical protein